MFQWWHVKIFLTFFVDKVESARRDSNKNSTLIADKALLVAPTNSAVFDQLDLVSLSSLGDSATFETYKLPFQNIEKGF